MSLICFSSILENGWPISPVQGCFVRLVPSGAITCTYNRHSPILTWRHVRVGYCLFLVNPNHPLGCSRLIHASHRARLGSNLKSTRLHGSLIWRSDCNVSLSFIVSPVVNKACAACRGQMEAETVECQLPMSSENPDLELGDSTALRSARNSVRGTGARFVARGMATEPGHQRTMGVFLGEGSIDPLRTFAIKSISSSRARRCNPACGGCGVSIRVTCRNRAYAPRSRRLVFLADTASPQRYGWTGCGMCSKGWNTCNEMARSSSVSMRHDASTHVSRTDVGVR